MDKKLELKKDGPIFILEDIEKSLQKIYDQFRSAKNTNDWLRKENERIQAENYKDEELQKIRERLKKMEDDYYRGFPVTEEEDKKITEWMTKQCSDGRSSGAIGGRFTYEFIPTGVGTIGTVIDSFTNERFTFRDL